VVTSNKVVKSQMEYGWQIIAVVLTLFSSVKSAAMDLFASCRLRPRNGNVLGPDFRNILSQS